MIDRIFWKKQFDKDHFPVWTCSKCNTGILELLPDTFHFQLTGESEISKECDAWDHEWVALRFTTFLKCNNKECQETAVLCGKGYVDQEVQYNSGVPEQVYVEYFTPEYCYPPPAFFKIPSKVPDEIKKEIIDSFSICFSQPNSAGNKIRTAIEKLLTLQRVNRVVISKKRKRIRLNLHDRILLYGKKNPELSKNILAIKWVGNSASHTEGLEIEDIFDAYDLLSYVLGEIYANSQKHIKKITKEINKKKGKR
jgi:Domain of unknown function (DUF4145)